MLCLIFIILSCLALNFLWTFRFTVIECLQHSLTYLLMLKYHYSFDTRRERYILSLVVNFASKLIKAREIHSADCFDCGNRLVISTCGFLVLVSLHLCLLVVSLWTSTSLTFLISLLCWVGILRALWSRVDLNNTTCTARLYDSSQFYFLQLKSIKLNIGNTHKLVPQILARRSNSRNRG